MGPRRVDPVKRRARFAAWLKDRCFLRFHMGVILGLAFAAGLAVTKLFLISGSTNLALRYGVAVAASYAAFMILLRLWLWYVAHTDDEGDADALDVLDAADVVNLVTNARGDQLADAHFQGAGGSFGGGGASGSFGESAADGVSSLVGADEDGCAVAVVLALAALVLAVFLGGLYLVYAAPTILVEAAFQALLAPVLIPAARRAEAEGWVPGAIRATVIPFACMFVAAVAFGLVANDLCPEARRMVDLVICAQR